MDIRKQLVHLITPLHHLTGSSDPSLYLVRGQQYKFTNNSVDIHLEFNQLQMVQQVHNITMV